MYMFCIFIDPQIWITQPPNDFHMVTFNSSLRSVQLMCTLSDTILPDMIFTWLHDGNAISTTPPNQVTQTNNTVTLLIGNPQPSDAGVYQCIFKLANGWVLKRNIRLLSTGSYVCVL